MAFALAPLVLVIIVFQFLLLKLALVQLKKIFTGITLSFLGLALFLQGVRVGFLPVAGMLGEQLGGMKHIWLAIPVGILLGFVATIAEPAVRILNYEVEKVSGGFITQTVMLVTISLGVAFSVGIAMARVIYGIPLIWILLPGYVLALLLAKFSPPNFVPVAFDSGGVATGPMTVTFLMAMTVGVASGIEGRDPLLDGFGMISLVALAPILSVLILGIIFGGRDFNNEAQ